MLVARTIVCTHIQTVPTVPMYVSVCTCVHTYVCIQTEHAALCGCALLTRLALCSCGRFTSLQIEEDTEGEIEMMAQTGPFSVPVRCRRKRCAVSGYLCMYVRCKDCLTLTVTLYAQVTPMPLPWLSVHLLCIYSLGML